MDAITQAIITSNVVLLRADLPKLTDAERKEIFDAVQDGYCRACGGETPDGVCHCQNDE